MRNGYWLQPGTWRQAGRTLQLELAVDYPNYRDQVI